MSYSQNNEEQIILDYFDGHPPARFYDIGAWSGMKFSNTRALIERGWRGVMIEPSPTAFVGLLENTREFGDRVTLVNAAITKEPSLAVFYDAAGDAIGTLDEKHRDKWQPHLPNPMRPFHTHTVAARDLFAAFGPAEFINLDVEGISHNLFDELPLSWPELKLICVEHDGFEKNIKTLASAYGFEQIGWNAENLILARPKS